MTNAYVVENKISAAQKYIKILKRYEKYSQKEIEKNVDIRGAIERYLYLACQSASDLADAYIAHKKFRKPTSLRESFYILNEEEIINHDLMAKMVKMTGFRNLIAHDYGKIDYSYVYRIIHNDIKDIEKFIKIIQSN